MAIILMIKQLYKVIDTFDAKKDYGTNIRKQYVKCLTTFQKGQTIDPYQFTKEHLNQFTKKLRPFLTNRQLVYHCITIGKKIGILQPIPMKKLGVAIPYDEFCQLETVQYFREQLRGPRYRNIDPKREMGTSNAYAYRLWHFNNWIHGKTFDFLTEIQTGQNTFQRQIKPVSVDSVEQLLKMYQQPYRVPSDYIKVVKKYLLDPIHKNKRAGSVKIDYCAIKSYFEKNDSPLNFKFDPTKKYKTTNGEDEQPSLSLDELMELLTVGNPNLTQKAVFLCKFHRGLDTSTLVDRFNFQAWPQLVEYFGTTDYERWDLSKCPVPIKLTRMKTDYTHTGFLDVDAIEAIQRYLEYRFKKTFEEMKEGDALFLNGRGEPIVNNWIGFSLKKLAENAGLSKQLEGYDQIRYKINSHELRDLLKSTLIDCGVRLDIAEHVIGHKPRDSYEKQAILYPDTLRKEYSKASKKINVFSNFSNLVKGFENTEEMKQEITTLKQQQQVLIESQKSMLVVLRQKGNIP